MAEGRLEALRDAWQRRGCFVTLAAAVALTIGAGWWIRRDHAPRVGADVRAVAFLDASGRRRTLGDFEGKVVVVDVWATWCPPCKASLPELARLQAAGGGRYAVLPLSVDDGGFPVVAAYLARQPAPVRDLQAYVPESRANLEPFGPISGIPTTILVDAQGKLVTRWSGFHPGRAEAELAVLLR
jgi:thiol-disulfide isomerase/thioredoxin